LQVKTTNNDPENVPGNVLEYLGGVLEIGNGNDISPADN
jgi:hypothetical protein